MMLCFPLSRILGKNPLAWPRTWSAPSSALAMLCLLSATSCSSPPPDGEVRRVGNTPVYENPPGSASHFESTFDVYILYKPQVEHLDFNGIFQAQARMINSDYWKAQFIGLTRQGFYDDFFHHFVELMRAYAASAHRNAVDPERLLQELRGYETSFLMFCESRDVKTAYETYKQRLQVTEAGVKK